MTPAEVAAGLQEAVAAFVAARTAPSDALCVGLSGGRDSVVLLHLLGAAVAPGRLTAIHVNHGLSPRAEAWSEFCARLCADWGVPLVQRRVEIDRSAGEGLEAAARRARYRAFADHGAPVLFLAHHRDDQAETLLFNLLRGTGVAGAGAMRTERAQGGQRILRPLLAVGGDAIAAYGAAAGLAWIDDESNGDTALARNFLRHEVMPLLASRFPAASARLAAAAAHFAEADHLLAELAAADWAALARGEGVRVAVLRTLEGPRLKNLLRWRLRVLGWRAPAASRLDEFARQLRQAGPGRRPQLVLPDGEMRVVRGVLAWHPAAGR